MKMSGRTKRQQILGFTLMLIGGQSIAGDFAARIAEGKAAAATVEGGQYERTLWPHFGSAMRECVPPGSDTKGNIVEFVLVGHVAKDGTVSRLEVEPPSRVADCFAAELARRGLPVPPELRAPVLAHPILVEMRVTP